MGNFNISNFSQQSMYKPDSLTYNNCIISSCYIDIYGTGSIHKNYNDRVNDSVLMIEVTPYFNNWFQKTNPYIFFTKNDYNFNSQNISIKINWKINTDLSLPYQQGIFVVKYGIKQSWIESITQSNAYNQFSINISKSIVKEFLDQRDKIDLSVGFVFTGSANFPPQSMCFCNARIEKI